MPAGAGPPNAPPARPSELPFKAYGLVVARWRTNVAERQAVFDERGSPASLATMQRDHVLANGAAEWFRIHAIASDEHQSPIGAVRTNPHCLTAGSWVGARNRSYAGCRLPVQRRACGVCTNLEGDDPPPSSQAERISLDYATGTCAFGAGSTAFSVRPEL